MSKDFQGKLSNPQFLIGEVTQVESKEFHIIKFKVDRYIDGQLAYPLGVVDEPVVGDEILLIELDPIFKTAYYYFKKKNDEHIQFRYKGKSISILDSSVEIKSKESSIVLKDNGDVDVNGTNVTVQGEKININGSSEVKVSGTSTIGTPGPFCALSNCLFSGTPHTSNKSQ